MAEKAQKKTSNASGSKEMEDPKQIYQKEFPKGQEQEHPGIEAEMTPRPDYGEKSYKGNNKLADMVLYKSFNDIVN